MFVIFVEGYYDEQFFKKFFQNSSFRIYQYSQKKKKNINQFIKTLSCISNSDYIFITDSDGLPTNQKINLLCETYPNLSKEKISVVKYEIESWYLAGVDESYCSKNKFEKFIFRTDTVTKEQFNNILPLYRKTRLQIMLNMLINYKIEIAKPRNDSLCDFFTEKEELVCCCF